MLAEMDNLSALCSYSLLGTVYSRRVFHTLATPTSTLSQPLLIDSLGTHSWRHISLSTVILGMEGAQDTVDSDLRSRLAAVLPASRSFTVYHISTPPTKTSALHSPPPRERPDRTYCESHFLAISIDAGVGSGKPQFAARSEVVDKEVLVLGIEIFIYTTAYSTTLFVSKADSTGFLHRMGLPKGTPSPIREVCSAFVGHLVENRRRSDVPFVVSLFARSQAQYLFPGSVNYHGKHILDDRGLIKWWCRVLDPLLEPTPEGRSNSARGYLVIPGLDNYETRAFIPRNRVSSSWCLSHPLETISHYTREHDKVPPRCLIPHFPDDPKTRLCVELDEEAARSGAMQRTGSWKSVKSLDAFWEMMAFRQECSSGRMTGFIWLVFADGRESKPISDTNEVEDGQGPSGKERNHKPASSINLPRAPDGKLFPGDADSFKRRLNERNQSNHGKNKSKSKSKKRVKKLRGSIVPRQPRIKTHRRNYLLKGSLSTAYYSWPQAGRGEFVVDENAYKRIVELLLHLDFANMDKASGSTKRWVSEVGLGQVWGLQVAGTRPLLSGEQHGAMSEGTNDASLLVKRKRAESSSQQPEDQTVSKVNVLGADVVKKKVKERSEPQKSYAAEQTAHELSSGLLRKKPKT